MPGDEPLYYIVVMRLEHKLVLISAISKIVIFLLLFLLVQQSIDILARRHTDRDLVKMKDKTMSIVGKIGIRNYLDAEQDSAFASYNILKDEFISITLDTDGKSEEMSFTEEARIIEDEEFDFRILRYNFEVDHKLYSLEVGKNIQMIYSLDRRLKSMIISVILVVLIITVLSDLGIFKYLLLPLNQKILPKLRTVENPETFEYTALASTTSDFVYLNNTINELMHKVSDILKNQKKFIGDVSHELFTPISVMQSKLDNMLVSGKLPAQTEQFILDQQRQLVRLQHIIKALLLISRIENDQYAKDDSFILRELVEEIRGEIEERATMREISIVNDVPGPVRLNGVNKYLVYTLLFNLVSNAIKYNREGGRVRIFQEASANRLFLSVEDTGIGIDPANLDKIFNRFSRVEQDRVEGHGLGLSIVSSIATYHDATVEVQSVPGEGSCFKIGFPQKNPSKK